MTNQAQAFMLKHKLVYKILNITESYFTFRGYIDNTFNLPVQEDSLWLSPKDNVVNSELFAQIPNNFALKRGHFSDTSKYAVLYLYRPGKLTNSLANYIIYFDNSIMCVAKNKSGYIFKILKEGQFEIKSRLFKDESSVMLNVRFGNMYYVKSMIHWGISRRLYNFKLEMAIKDSTTGKTEFEDVSVQD